MHVYSVKILICFLLQGLCKILYYQNATFILQPHVHSRWKTNTQRWRCLQLGRLSKLTHFCYTRLNHSDAV